MKRYLKIYLMIIKINFAMLFTYRANFYNSIAISVGWGVVSISTIFLITAKTTHIYSWRREDLYLLAGFFSIVLGIFHMFFSASMERFGRIISLGELDSYLLTPIDTQWYLSTKIFRPVAFLRLLIGIFFTVYILQNYHIGFNPISLVYISFFLILGILLLYSIWFIVITLLVWNPNLSNLVDFLYILNNFGRYPSSIVTYTKNVILDFVVPIMLITTVPAEILLGRPRLVDMLILSVCAISLFILSRFFWKYALKQYTSASS